MKPLTAPLRRAENALRDEVALLIPPRKREAEIKEKRAKKAAEDAARGDDDESMAEVLHLDREAAEARAKVPTLPTLLAADVTVEKAARLMCDQDGRLALVSAEGTLLQHMLGMYSSGAHNLDAWLQGHVGDTITIHRIKDDDEVRVEDPRLSVLLATQPDRLDEIAASAELRGRGALGRFCYVQPRQNVGWRDLDPPPVSPSTETAYAARVDELTRHFRGVEAPLTVRLDAEARSVFRDYRARNEADQRPGHLAAPMEAWMAKAAGLVLRVAGVLHVAEHGPGGVKRPVTGRTVAGAVALVDYLTEHATAALVRHDQDDEDVSRALMLGDAIADRGLTEVTVKGLHDKVRGRRCFHSVEAVRKSLDTLAGHGWVVPQPVEARAPGQVGQPPSPTYRVHPALAREALRGGSADSADSADGGHPSPETARYESSRSSTTTSSYSPPSVSNLSSVDGYPPSAESAESAESPTPLNVTPLRPLPSPGPADPSKPHFCPPGCKRCAAARSTTAKGNDQ